MASRSSACPVASLTVEQGRRLRGGGKRHLRRADRRQELRLHLPGRADRARRPARGSRSRSATTSSSARSHPRIDIPAKVSGQVHVRPERAHPGDVARPLGRARAAPAPTPRRTTSRSASTRARSRTSRALRSFGSATSSPSSRRRSTTRSRRAAQLKVVWKSDPKFGSGSSGNFWSWLRKAGDTNTHEPGPLHRRTTATSTPRSQSAAKTVSATYKYHYNGFMPIGPHARGRRRQHGTARPCSSRASRSRASRRRPRARCSSMPAAEHPGDLVRGLELVRRRHAGAGSRAGGGHLAEDRQAGAPAVDALGPARLGPLRPGAHVRRQDGRRREAARSSAPTGRRTARPAATLDHDAGSCSAPRRWAATPASGGPNPSDAGASTTRARARAGAREDAAAVRRLAQATVPSARRTRRSPTSPASRSSTSSRTRRTWTRSRSAGRTSTARRSPVARWLSVLDACDDGRRLEAEGRRVQPAERRRRDRPRLRLRHVRVQPGRRDRRHRGRQEDRARSWSSTSTSPRTTGSRSASTAVGEPDERRA